MGISSSITKVKSTGSQCIEDHIVMARMIPQTKDTCDFQVKGEGKRLLDAMLLAVPRYNRGCLTMDGPEAR